MSDAIDRVAALAKLIELAQPSVQPTLSTTASTGEVDVILDRNKRASTWAASTAYTFGQIVMPTTRNGHRYRCVVAGTSESTEPTWPKTNGSIVAEGDLEWEEYGPQFDNVYDVRQAAHECWQLKTAKASELFTEDQLKFGELHQNCKAMRDSFAPLGVF